MMIRSLPLLSLVVALTIVPLSVGVEATESRELRFPPLEDGRLVLSVDTHTHSVFSDGHVWPTVRVWEANKDRLDAMAITEHLEYQPNHDNNFKRIKSTPRKLIYIAGMLSDVQEVLDRGDIQSASYIIYNAKQNLFYLEREQEWVEQVMEEQNEEYINYISKD